MAFKPYCSKCSTWHYHCPRCSSVDVVPDRPMLTCNACNYVGPIKNPNQNGTYLVSSTTSNTPEAALSPPVKTGEET